MKEATMQGLIHYVQEKEREFPAHKDAIIKMLHDCQFKINTGSSPQKEIADCKAAIDRLITPTKPKSTDKIERPKAGTMTGKVWDVCDLHKAEHKDTILAMCVADGINIGTARVQYGKWLKFQSQK